MSFDTDPRENECPSCNEYEKERIVLQTVINDLGSWASAAQEDTKVCKELKAIFLRVIDLTITDTKRVKFTEYEDELLPNAGQGEL